MVNHKNKLFKFFFLKGVVKDGVVKDEDLKGTLGVLRSVSSNEPNRRNLISNDNEGFVENRIKHALRIGLLHRLLAVLFHIVVPGRQACTIDQARETGES